MAGNLDDFLKRAQERRRQRQQQNEGGARNQPPPPTPQRRPPPPPPSQQPRPAPPLQSHVVEPDIIIADEAPQPLRPHIDTSDFEERATHMVDEVAMADDDMDAHIHEAFDHDLGQLTESAAEKKARVAAAAHPIMKMIASKQGVQQAVIMAEILQRPSFFD